MTCSNCGANNRLDAHFCETCGGALSIVGVSHPKSTKPADKKIFIILGISMLAIGAIVIGILLFLNLSGKLPSINAFLEPTPCAGFLTPQKTNNDFLNNKNTSEYGDWIYYSNSEDNGYLYKKKRDGSSSVLLAKDVTYSVYVVGNWIYYCSEYIYKIKSDGSERVRLNSENSSFIINILNDWILYGYQSGFDSGGTLVFSVKRMKTDGSLNSEVAKIKDSSFEVVGDKVFFYEEGIDYKKDLCRMNEDGSEKIKIVNNINYNYFVDGDWIYYNYYDEVGNGYINKVKVDGSSSTKVYSEGATISDVGFGWIQVNDGEPMSTINKIVSVKMDGTSKVNLFESEYNSYLLKKEWYYYCDNTRNGNLYKVKNDGSGRVQLNFEKTSELSSDENNIFFKTEGNDAGIYRMTLDGTQITRLIAGKFSDIVIKDNYIYYINTNLNNAYYRMKTDGTSNIELAQGVNGWTINFYGDRIVYDIAGTNSGYRDAYIMKNDGTEKKLLVSEISETDSYYRKEFNGNIFMFTKSGLIVNSLNNYLSSSSKKINLASYDFSNMYYYEIYNNWIYYSLPSETYDTDMKRKMYKVKIDGTGNTMIGFFTEVQGD
ncbi:MAG: DUF5050 domain-containing protein [Bacillota bacterium]